MNQRPPGAPPGSQALPSHVDPEQWVDAYADLLYRHALARVRDPSTAQDLVQEVFLAAWRCREKRSNVASEQGWLLGILKNKIADYFRRYFRSQGLVDSEELRDFEESQFDGASPQHWRTSPREWLDPKSHLERAEFWKVLHECAQKLPVRTARVFVLREVEEMSADEICRLLDIRQNHLFVILHRARMAIRQCLEWHWFGHRPQRAESAGGDLC